MRIRRLPEGVINRIAAGEVVERPASVVKELVENALDAGATRIDVVFRGGGRHLIRVTDDGIGMGPEDLALAVERHATSKLNGEDLTDIRSFGFRGEALPSIAAVSRLTISSRPGTGGTAHSISVEGGSIEPVKPAALGEGTDVTVRDLFYATPARLKFLKGERAEAAEAADVMRRLAIAHPAIGFVFATEDRRLIDAPPGESQEERIARIMGREFMANAVPLVGRSEDVELQGFAGLPTWSRGQASLQFAFVNGRPVRDKLLWGALRGAYADLMAPGRHAAAVLFLTCAPERVDVNVHPAKTEVRFRDSGLVRGLIVGTIRRSLGAMQVRSTTSLAQATGYSFREGTAPSPPGLSETQAAFEMNMPPAAASPETAATEPPPSYPLGVARGQLHGNYIVTQTADGLILVDQHAAHERLVYERLKRERAASGIAVQPLLIPQVVDLDPVQIEHLSGAGDLLRQSGLLAEPFGEGAVIVREIPAAIAQGDLPALLRDLADELAELDASSAIEERINHVLATIACHHSVRSGRILRPEEMNALLREMEVTPNSGQCNHGRPTFIELKLADIERLFGRR